MPIGIKGRSDTEVSKHNECENPIFESREEMNRSLSRLCNGNLHVIGSLWVEAMKSVLVGHKMCLIPTVHAAKEEPPKRPPKMKYKDLPLYERPHWEYKQHEEDESVKCLGNNKKILQSLLYPTISKWRKDTFQNCSEFAKFLKEAIAEVSADIVQQKNSFKSYMRAKENFEYRRALVIFATAAGFLLGSRKKGYLYQKLFWATVGALSTGYLCFPKETDETLRDVCYEGDKVFLMLSNFWTGGNAQMPVIGPCDKDKPPRPPKRFIDKKHSCEVKKPPPPPPPKPKPAPPKKEDICVEQNRY